MVPGLFCALWVGYGYNTVGKVTMWVLLAGVLLIFGFVSVNFVNFVKKIKKILIQRV